MDRREGVTDAAGGRWPGCVMLAETGSRVYQGMVCRGCSRKACVRFRQEVHWCGELFDVELCPRETGTWDELTMFLETWMTAGKIRYMAAVPAEGEAKCRVLWWITGFGTEREEILNEVWQRIGTLGAVNVTVTEEQRRRNCVYETLRSCSGGTFCCCAESAKSVLSWWASGIENEVVMGDGSVFCWLVQEAQKCQGVVDDKMKGVAASCRVREVKEREPK